MGADWNQIITRAGEFFPTIAAPVAIIFGIGIAMWIMDWMLDRFAGVGSRNDPISDSQEIPRLSRTPRSSAASAGRTRAPASSNSTTPANTAGTSTSGTTTRGKWGGGG